jgi:hypothetical protein
MIDKTKKIHWNVDTFLRHTRCWVVSFERGDINRQIETKGRL